MPFTIGGEWVPQKKPSSASKKCQVIEQKRKGKWITLVQNLQLDLEDLKVVAQYLKQTCHTGGTVKNQVIELQGQLKEKITQALRDTPKGSFKV